ncbi:hypothetical protein ZIOFF_017282 [Zingiber officinale]|uniref:Uncharacterized protein n=1 Tax=Zingiber officinale TaxID=94328 RepID=A0A8J5LL79_ZINOF|nr:hypothetical protein ZIOFF_017282 [Zingiber officinale]
MAVGSFHPHLRTTASKLSFVLDAHLTKHPSSSSMTKEVTKGKKGQEEPTEDDEVIEINTLEEEELAEEEVEVVEIKELEEEEPTEKSKCWKKKNQLKTSKLLKSIRWKKKNRLNKKIKLLKSKSWKKKNRLRSYGCWEFSSALAYSDEQAFLRARRSSDEASFQWFNDKRGDQGQEGLFRRRLHSRRRDGHLPMFSAQDQEELPKSSSSLVAVATDEVGDSRLDKVVESGSAVGEAVEGGELDEEA